jgi:hypothetical protein
MNLSFVVPCVFNHSNKTTNYVQQSIVKFMLIYAKYAKQAGDIYVHNKFYNWLLHRVGCFIRVIEDARNHKP